MEFFTSTRERNLWRWALLVTIAIYASLFMGNPLARLVEDQNIAAIFFLLGMAVVAGAILFHSLETRPGKIELAVGAGFLAVFIMFFLRLGLAEGSHVIEYSILAIFIDKAINERVKQGKNIAWPSMVAWVISLMIGVIDESIQIFIPDRIFDPTDIAFNGIAVTLAIVPGLLIKWVRKRIRKTVP
ncbi:MAG: VanZ family protein [Saprospiraceae bacterium]|nr:VanZ family protein [Saprospiraceae bacterium]